VGRDDFKNVVQSRPFSADWDRLGLDDVDLKRLEQSICDSPLTPPVVAGTGGVRKIRFAKRGAGKSGGYRVFYSYSATYRTVLLLVVIAKGENENISVAEKSMLKRLVDEFESYLERAHK